MAGKWSILSLNTSKLMLYFKMSMHCKKQEKFLSSQHKTASPWLFCTFGLDWLWMSKLRVTSAALRKFWGWLGNWTQHGTISTAAAPLKKRTTLLWKLLLELCIPAYETTVLPQSMKGLLFIRHQQCISYHVWTYMPHLMWKLNNVMQIFFIMRWQQRLPKFVKSSRWHYDDIIT